MPYVRCGKCVYKGEKCSTKGEKVGCSDSIEKAKKYLIKLRMETSEGVMKVTKNKLIQLIKEELEVTLTDDEVEEMFDIKVSKETELAEASYERVPTEREVPTLTRPGSVPTEKVSALQRPSKEDIADPWKIIRMIFDFVSALERRIEALEATIKAPQE
jgi:hypothetical protein